MPWMTTENVSSGTRLTRIYPQTESDLHTPGDVDFIHRINTVAHWYVASSNKVFISSSITVGV